MELKEAYDIVKRDLIGRAWSKEEHVARLCQLVEDVRHSAEWFRHCEKVHDKHHKRTGDMMAHGLSLGFQQCAESLERTLGAWTEEEKEPTETCCGGDCELSSSESAIRYVVYTSHVGGKREHRVCQRCFAKINQEAQRIREQIRRNHGNWWLHGEWSKPYLVGVDETYQYAIYIILGSAKVLSTGQWIPDAPVSPQEKIGQEW